jgi:hypothetical protein
MSAHYPGYDVLAKWDSLSFDDKTRAALAKRLENPPPRRFFSPDEWRLLEAVAARLLPQPDRAQPIPITAWIDARLAEGRSEGFRDARMPPQEEVWRRGLAGVEAEAQVRFAASFADLAPELQDEVLRRVQAGEIAGGGWEGLDPARFFRDALLKTVAGLYYAHPAAWSEIGFGGPASPRGYVRMGFDERDPWEAKEA